MEKIFIAGSLKIRTLDKNIKERLDNIIRNKIEVLVGYGKRYRFWFYDMEWIK